MSKHTPEPWRQSGNELVGGEGTTAAFVVCKAAYGHTSPAPVFSYIGPEARDHRPVVDANMRRIVACVNALAGIDDPAAFRAQRDDLLAALRRCLTDAPDSLNANQMSRLLSAINRQASAAIAKAEGKA